MKILIATGIYPPDIGGPATYAFRLSKEWRDAGHSVSVSCYRLEKKLPSGLRHVWFFFRTLLPVYQADIVFALDTLSVGLPTVILCKLLQRKIVLRIGGDFLWESYIERVKKLVPLDRFYTIDKEELTLKEKLIRSLTQKVLSLASAVAFTTEWQRDLWLRAYTITIPVYIVENHFELDRQVHRVTSDKRVFVSSSRNLFLKNIDLLKRAVSELKSEFPDILLDVSRYPQDKMQDVIAASYAVVVPSVSEVSPNLVLEALSVGVPCIVTEKNGLNKSFREALLVVNPGSIEDVKEKISYLLNPHNFLLAKKRISELSFSRPWSVVANDFLSIFKTFQ